MRVNHGRGFSLIELVIVTLVISVGLIGLTGLFGNTSKSLSTNDILQQASQYAQECAERAVAIRRHSPTPTTIPDGFDWFATNTFTCGTVTNFTFSDASSTPKLVGDLVTGSGTTNPCPAPLAATPAITNNCRTISVKVTSQSDPALSSSVTVLLVKY
jgi:prepilin-type N-terminal cleavage/methylation domain-containing protein